MFTTLAVGRFSMNVSSAGLLRELGHAVHRPLELHHLPARRTRFAMEHLVCRLGLGRGAGKIAAPLGQSVPRCGGCADSPSMLTIRSPLICTSVGQPTDEWQILGSTSRRGCGAPAPRPRARRERRAEADSPPIAVPAPAPAVTVGNRVDDCIRLDSRYRVLKSRDLVPDRILRCRA